MKVSDLFDDNVFETAEAGMTSVSTIGSLEYTPRNSFINLYKRDPDGNPHCVAKICRKPYNGWRFVTTKAWKDMNLPHFGNLEDIRSPLKGKKTISDNLAQMLKQWGIKIDGLSINESLD